MKSLVSGTEYAAWLNQAKPANPHWVWWWSTAWLGPPRVLGMPATTGCSDISFSALTHGNNVFHNNSFPLNMPLRKLPASHLAPNLKCPKFNHFWNQIWYQYSLDKQFKGPSKQHSLSEFYSGLLEILQKIQALPVIREVERNSPLPISPSLLQALFVSIWSPWSPPLPTHSVDVVF